MASKLVIESLLVFLVVIIAAYTIIATFGAAYDGLYNAFVTYLAGAPMSVAWKATITSILGLWYSPIGMFGAAKIAVIATGVWVAMRLITNVDYNRGFN